MSIVYLLTLAAVGIAVLALLIDAVLSVSRREDWQAPTRALKAGGETERRHRRLPFVGRDRRALAVDETAPAASPEPAPRRAA